MRDEGRDPEASFEQVATKYHRIVTRINEQLRKRIIGQDEVVYDVLISLVCGGHVLVEGVPGLGKTELLKSLAASVDATFARIQFTPDLMPADVVGTEVLRTAADGTRSLEYRPGPLFANLVLADEINRATPKTQSAMLEAMQERQITVGGETRAVPHPFMVLATQNPIELEGTYPLPEAQLDRFFMKVLVPVPATRQLAAIIADTTGADRPQVEPVATPEDLDWLIAVTRRVPIARHLIDHAATLITATHPDTPHATELVRRYVRAGASPRGGQALVLAAKARAIFEGRPYVAGADVSGSALATLRHRVLLGFDAAADGVDTDRIIDEVVAATPEPEMPDRRGAVRRRSREHEPARSGDGG